MSSCRCRKSAGAGTRATTGRRLWRTATSTGRATGARATARATCSGTAASGSRSFPRTRMTRSTRTTTTAPGSRGWATITCSIEGGWRTAPSAAMEAMARRLSTRPWTSGARWAPTCRAAASARIWSSSATATRRATWSRTTISRAPQTRARTQALTTGQTRPFTKQGTGLAPFASPCASDCRRGLTAKLPPLRRASGSTPARTTRSMPTSGATLLLVVLRR